MIRRIRRRPWRAAVAAVLVAATATALAALPGGGAARDAGSVDAAIAGWRWAPSPVATPGSAAPEVERTVAGRAVEPRVGGEPPAAEPPEADAPAPAPAQADPEPVAPPAPAPSVKGDLARAEVLENGIALPPLDAPPQVEAIIEAGNNIARHPYKWGGGHGRWQDNGYDCSGSVSFALASAGLLSDPLDSSRLMRWGRPGRGRWVTVWSNPGHVWLEVAGVRFDTSGRRRTGSRWQKTLRPTSGYVARHPKGL